MSSSLVMHDLQHGSTRGYTASVFAWTDSARRPPYANVSSPSPPVLVPSGMYSNSTLDVPASIEVHLPLPPSTTATTTPPSEPSAMLLSPLQTQNLPAGFLELKTTRLTAYCITKENFRLPTTWCAQEYAKLPLWQGGEKSMMIWNPSPDGRLRFRISPQVHHTPDSLQPPTSRRCLHARPPACGSGIITAIAPCQTRRTLMTFIALERSTK
jgi:hypothetical protein